MRQDQYERLQALTEKLMDVFLTEADPDEWPGKGLKLGEMDAKTRGDLYWVRKTAASAAVLHGKALHMLDGQRGIVTDTAARENDDEAAQLDTDIQAAEAEAKRLLLELQAGGGKAKKEFEKRVHGKAAR